MFLGHYGIGLSAKKAAPISLGILFIACQFLDLLWPTFLLLNIEHASINPDTNSSIQLIFTDYPYSHSLVMAIGWSLLFGLVYWLFKRNWYHAFILGLVVLSHWFLDFIVHLPDLPLSLASDSTKVGLKLWNQPIVSASVELLIFIIGLILYMRSTRAKNKTGSIVLWILVALLLVSFIASIFSPPPTSISQVAWVGQSMWLFVILAFWVERNREYVSRK